MQDLFFPRNNSLLSSINNQINTEDFRCNWGTLNDIKDIVINAPINAEATTVDVDVALFNGTASLILIIMPLLVLQALAASLDGSLML